MCYVAHFLYTSEYTFLLLLSMNQFRNIPPATFKSHIFITTASQYRNDILLA